MRFDLLSAGALAPGIGSLDELLALHRGEHAPDSIALQLPSPQALPANERRRASQVVRLTLACAAQALEASPFAVDQLRMVFASDEGTGEVCQQMLESLATTREVSPLVFHNSVHNAPSGYFSIGYQNRQSALSVSLGRESFASGLLCAVSEACSSGQPVLFLNYDTPMPQPMRALLGVEQASATAWVIAAAAPTQAPHRALARFELSLQQGEAASSDGDDDVNVRSRLPASWADNGSAQGFIALALLAGVARAFEFPLGAQRLRLARVDVDEAAAC